MAKEPVKADFGPEADAAARAEAGAPPSAGLFQGPQPKGDPAPAGGVEVELISKASGLLTDPSLRNPLDKARPKRKGVKT
jgi:hypothetical protein